MASYISGLPVYYFTIQQNVELGFATHNVDQITVIVIAFAYVCYELVALRKKCINFFLQWLEFGFSEQFLSS